MKLRLVHASVTTCSPCGAAGMGPKRQGIPPPPVSRAPEERHVYSFGLAFGPKPRRGGTKLQFTRAFLNLPPVAFAPEGPRKARDEVPGPLARRSSHPEMTTESLN